MQIIVSIPGRNSGVMLTFACHVIHQHNEGSDEHLKEFEKACERCGNVYTVKQLLALQAEGIINIIAH